MIKQLCQLFIIFFVGIPAFAQSPFTKFVEKKDIQWAAIHTSNIRFKNVNLSLLLRKKLSTNSIKVALYDIPETFGQLEYSTKKAILKKLNPGMDEGIDISNDSLFSRVSFDNESGDMVELQQVFYVEKGILQSFTTTASPKFTVVTSYGVALGIGNAFTTAFNKDRSLKRSWKKKAIFLGNQTDSFQNLSIQKQLYGQGLLKTIWPFLDDNKYEILRLDSSRIIKKADINLSLTKVSDPETLEYSMNQVILLGPDSFSIAGIEQDFFYNEDKNIIFSNIRSLLLSFEKRLLLKILIK